METVPVAVFAYVIEAGLLSSAILGISLWRSRRDRRRLQALVATFENARPADAARACSSLATHHSAAGAASLQLRDSEQSSDDASSGMATLLEANETMQQVIAQLREKNAELRQQVEALQRRGGLKPEDHHKIAQVVQALRESEETLTVLQRVNARLKEDLREKTRQLRTEADELTLAAQRLTLLQGTIKELRTANARLTREGEKKDRLLLALQKETADAQQMKQELWDLKSRLAQREADFHRLQVEHDSLSDEYQRLFESFQM